MICRNGTQFSKLSDIFGRIVFQAIGKYINPTRYRQIIETESAKKLSPAEQANVTEDQKHTSAVAKIHYQKLKSEQVAKRAKSSLEKLRNSDTASKEILNINNQINSTKVTDFCISENNHENNAVSANYRQKKVAFSQIEDNFIRQGISKYGNGKWTAILNDQNFKFHPSRKAATLAVRAKKLIGYPTS